MRKFRPLRCAFVLTLVGCTGSIEGVLGPSGDVGARSDQAAPGAGNGGLPEGQATSGAPGQAAAPLTCVKRGAGESPFRRLTKAQFARTVEELVGVVPDVSGFPADDVTHGFEVGVSTSALLIEAYANSAEKVAQLADVNTLIPCDPAEGEEACAKQFIERFARRALRRATREDERAALFAVYEAGRRDGTFEQGVRLVVEALLQSPSFAYHVETSDGVDGDGLRPLTPYALASRLSYLLWGSLPDDALLDAAAAGKLATVEGLEGEARRMLSARPEAARRGFRDFYRQWLSLDALDTMERDETQYPEFTPALAKQLGESLSRQIDDVVWEEGGSLDDLLLDDSAYVNAAVAPLFGLTAADAAFAEQTLDGAQRRGILTHPALLSVLSKPNQSDPVIRGKFVRERLLCQPLPPPPANVVTVPPDPRPGLTTRQRFAEHSASPTCAGCHRLMDPIGFGLENFDALGRYRSSEEGVTIDASGEVVASVDLNGTFNGALELAERLAESKSVRDCVAKQYFRFALSRTESDADSCSLVSTIDGFEAQAGTLSELILAVVKSDAFRYLAPTEVQP